MSTDTAVVTEALATPLPPLPDSGLTRFRADLRRQLGPDDFALADALYRQAMDSACAFLTGHPDYHADPVPRAACRARALAPAGSPANGTVVCNPFASTTRPVHSVT
ncbi:MULTISPECIES: hypothetical protein [unclassified Nonomuraea]|uniref:hypothetical protein n=1 Tax=Nonomuraea sp. NPDC047529 TaxID=3155623 RepID=UPI0033ED611A